MVHRPPLNTFNVDYICAVQYIVNTDSSTRKAAENIGRATVFEDSHALQSSVPGFVCCAKPRSTR